MSLEGWQVSARAARCTAPSAPPSMQDDRDANTAGAPRLVDTMVDSDEQMAPGRDSHASAQKKLAYERYYLEPSILNQSTHRPRWCPESTVERARRLADRAGPC